MKKLNLNKQEVIKLSNGEMDAVHGGGIKRSRRRYGDCAYSRAHPSGAISITEDGTPSGVGWCMSSMD